MKLPTLSKVVQDQIRTPSPIRQIMKMADRKNIEAMGLKPEDVISFGGGWVNHEAPPLLLEKYREICSDPRLFHESGGYSATLGDMRFREAIAEFEQRIMGVKEIEKENIIIGCGSTQLTHDAFLALVNPGEDVVLLDPTYANYYGQMVFALTDNRLEKQDGMKRVVTEAEVAYLPVLDTEEWRYMPDPEDALARLEQLCSLHSPKLILFPSPDNPTSQVLCDRFVDGALELCEQRGMFLLIDMAYETQVFGERPAYFSYSPAEHPHLVTLHSNSKWGRGLGRRLGWVAASKEVIDGMERVQQCTILCPDTLHQMAFAAYLAEAIPDGSLSAYLRDATRAYERAARMTISAIDRELGMRRLVPQGGLYTVMDVGTDADELVLDVLRHTGVLMIPGRGFGRTLVNAVRLSYGPLVNDLGKIKEGIERIGAYLSGRDRA
ncbi:MAG: pyridoxal phosphate-dependent aminotransferase [Candidatus Thermoplasmatota archaeon]